MHYASLSKCTVSQLDHFKRTYTDFEHIARHFNLKLKEKEKKTK
jgi:hypothetical protein